MESTGKYYIPVYNVLESHISNIVVANPKWVRAVKGEKDDDKDAKWIADLFKFDIVRSSFIPQKDFRILRELTRYKYKLVNMRSSEKNRFQNALTSGNCKLDMVFTDVFGKSASNIIDLILSDNPYTDEDILSKVHKKCKASPDMILDSVNGTDLTPVQKSRIELVNDHIKQLSSNIQRLDKLIDLMIEPYEDYISFLCQIPGVSRNSAIIVLSEIGVDMNQFTSTRRLTSWAGLTPSSNQSAGKKRAFIVIARKILIAAYHMLLTGEIWNPADLAEVETPVEQRIKYVKNNLKSDIKQLLDIGLTVEELTLMIQQNANIIATQ